MSKHVDFVLCRPGDVRPMVAIELDDASHAGEARQARDAFLDEAFVAAGLPLLHFPCKASYDADRLRERIVEAISGTSDARDTGDIRG
jgi:hypothetical protein